MEIEQDGFQRILQGPETTFAALSESLLALDGVKSAGKLLSSIYLLFILHIYYCYRYLLTYFISALPLLLNHTPLLHNCNYHTAAGYLHSRNETAIGIIICMEQTFDEADFRHAFTSVFDKLGTAEEMFGVAENQGADVSSLLANENATLMVAYDLTFSFGFKIDPMVDFFSVDTSASS